MARYRGPKIKIVKRVGEPIFGPSKVPPPNRHARGEHRRKQGVRSEYALQLAEKQKAKFTYGLLEKQFANLFHKAVRSKGVTGEVMLQRLEARLDNFVYRLGIATTRSQARQLVSHKHITVNGSIVNIPSYTLKPGDLVGVNKKSVSSKLITENANKLVHRKKYAWLEWDQDQMIGKMNALPLREEIPEKINEQRIVELYSK